MSTKNSISKFICIMWKKTISKIFNQNNFRRVMLLNQFFFSRLLMSTKIRYWSIELKITNIIWILKKVRHIIKTLNQSIKIIIYIDHDVALDITKQTSFFTSFTNKLNFRLVKTLNYIQRFNFNIRHKSSK